MQMTDSELREMVSAAALAADEAAWDEDMPESHAQARWARYRELEAEADKRGLYQQPQWVDGKRTR